MSRQVAMGRRRTAGTISRRTLGTLMALAVAALVVVLIASEVNHAVSKLGLPLTNADVIRRQAAEKRLDPALIAAVIYAE
jgi:soluble lytic murein transglycosylase